MNLIPGALLLTLALMCTTLGYIAGRVGSDTQPVPCNGTQEHQETQDRDYRPHDRFDHRWTGND